MRSVALSLFGAAAGRLLAPCVVRSLVRSLTSKLERAHCEREITGVSNLDATSLTLGQNAGRDSPSKNVCLGEISEGLKNQHSFGGEYLFNTTAGPHT